MKNNGTEYKSYIPNQTWFHRNLQFKLENISDVVCNLNSDIIALQEVENFNSLNLLQKSLKNIGCEYQYKSISETKNSPIQVAILSKYKIFESKDIIVPNNRNILRTYFKIDNSHFYIYNNHWKSKPKFEKQRIISALELKKDILKLNKYAKYIILGDFNSNYINKKSIKKSGIVNILNSKLNLKNFSKSNKKFIHYNLWYELNKKNRWSYNFFGKKSGLDNILISKNLLNGDGLNYIPNSFSILKENFLFHKKGYINRWEIKKNIHSNIGYSDHLPISAKFSTDKKFQDLNKNSFGKIEDLYKKNLKLPMLLKDIRLIIDFKNNGIIKQSKTGRGIFIYGKKNLQKNISYNIVVKSIKNYYGLLEIDNFEIVKTTNINKKFDFFNENISKNSHINNIYKNIIGIYKNNRIFIKDFSYPIYFTNKENSIFKNGDKIFINKSYIGFFKEKQLVIVELFLKK